MYNDTLFRVLLYSDIEDIKSICISNKYTLNNLCNSMYFWEQKFKLDNLYLPNYKPINFKEWYEAYNYWTYGCNFTGIHYSGNFWWSKPSHIKRLSDSIPDYYTAPEDWVSMLYFGQQVVPVHSEYYSAFNSGLEGMGHYTNLYPETNYR